MTLLCWLPLEDGNPDTSDGRCSPLFVEHPSSYLQEKMCSTLAPPHLLFSAWCAELVLTFYTGLSMEHNLSSCRPSIVRKIDDLMNVVRTL